MTTAAYTPSLGDLITFLADDLAEPDSDLAPGLAQSLGQGAAGIALLHLERAATGAGDPATAHAWLQAAAGEPVSATARAGLYAGAPALAFVLDIAERSFPGRYTPHRDRLLDLVVQAAHQRLDTAGERLRAGRPTHFAEYDLISGLTGIGRLLLRIRPDEAVLGRILEHLIALTHPIRRGADRRIGWWVDHDPDPILPTHGGHANFGLAHGISGPLAFLSIAYTTGRTVEGQLEAITAITEHLSGIAQHGPTGTWWPQWTAAAGNSHEHGHPPRPSWCYGTPGIARAVQLAAIATCNATLQRLAEQALAVSLAHPAHHEQLTEAGLCHGWAGACLTAWYAARDAASPDLARLLPETTASFVTGFERSTSNRSLLGGTAGIALTAMQLAADATSTTGWEQCLLLT
ncbi:lanthionine synthetase C family protein [Glycomyces tenuis]|uniref:lanthionine synthetase C family protein n=1 Tax=Glycomyces tenuis TaxID=58116 RepID=UPI00041604AD|nr:lanthionine synthetase C family protein [Glycomyces tenuis]